MRTIRFTIFIMLGLCLMGQTCWATKSYVTDLFKITLRSGPSIQNKIVIMLRSGQPLEVLETKDDWTRVRFLNSKGNEIEGWVMSRYLITRRPWEVQAKLFMQGNIQLKEKLALVEKELTETGHREQATTRGLGEKTQAFNRLQKNYDALRRGSADYLKLKKKHDVAMSTLSKSEMTVKRLSKENSAFRSSQRNRWFGMGALVLLCGLMIGLAVGRHQKKQRSSIIFD